MNTVSTPIRALDVNSPNAQGWSAGAWTLEQVFRKHFRLIYETGLHITGNPHDADDVVQNTFLQLIRGKRPLHSLEHPAAYLRRAALHQALKILASRKRVDLTSDIDRFDAPAPPPADASGDAERQLLRFIQELKPAAAQMNSVTSRVSATGRSPKCSANPSRWSP